MSSLIESIAAIFQRIEQSKAAKPEYLRVMLGNNTTSEMYKQIKGQIELIEKMRPQMVVKIYHDNMGPSKIIPDWPFIGYRGYALKEYNDLFGKSWVENPYWDRSEIKAFGLDEVMKILNRIHS